MASRRRPRTRVYDCNFNIGQSYYKPVMDSLDRKYGSKPLEGVSPFAEREGTPTRATSFLLDATSDKASARANRLASEFESNGIESKKPYRTSLCEDNDDAAIDEEFEATMKRIKAARAKRNAELEEEFDNFASKKKLNFADHLLDSVGLNSKTQKSIEDDVFYKQKNASKQLLDDEDEGKIMTKWTAVRPGAKALQEIEDTADEVSAVARARKSRAKLADIDAELEDLAARGAARQKRISDLKAIMDETSEAAATSSVKVSKRISVKSTAEKKQVTF